VTHRQQEKFARASAGASPTQRVYHPSPTPGEPSSAHRRPNRRPISGQILRELPRGPRWAWRF
jgi:hypothetical protein